jgi:methionyl-tRNA synthetase
MESFVKRYNSDLANDFGNLLNRVSGLITKNFKGFIPQPGASLAPEDRLRQMAQALGPSIRDLIGQWRLNEAIETILQLVCKANKYLEEQAPWKVAQADPTRAGTILYTATEALRISAIHLVPVMPLKTRKVLEVLGAAGTGPQWGGLRPGVKLQEHEALFPRLELNKKL